MNSIKRINWKFQILFYYAFTFVNKSINKFTIPIVPRYIVLNSNNFIASFPQIEFRIFFIFIRIQHNN